MSNSVANWRGIKRIHGPFGPGPTNKIFNTFQRSHGIILSPGVQPRLVNHWDFGLHAHGQVWRIFRRKQHAQLSIHGAQSFSKEI
jgi:hypothetical protein